MHASLRFAFLFFLVVAFVAVPSAAQDDDDQAEDEDDNDLYVYIYQSDFTCGTDYYEGFEDGFAQGYEDGQDAAREEQEAQEQNDQNNQNGQNDQNNQNNQNDQNNQNGQNNQKAQDEVDGVPVHFEEGSQCMQIEFDDQNNNNNNNNNGDGDDQQEAEQYAFRIVLNENSQLAIIVYSSREGCEYEEQLEQAEIAAAQEQNDQNGNGNQNDGNQNADGNNNNQDNNNNNNNQGGNNKQDDQDQEVPEYSIVSNNRIFCDECTRVMDHYYISTQCVSDLAIEAGKGSSNQGSSNSEAKKYTSTDMAVGVILAAAGVGLLVAAFTGCRSKRNPTHTRRNKRSYVRDDDEV